MHWRRSDLIRCVRARRWTDTCASHLVRTTTTTTTTQASISSVPTVLLRHLWKLTQAGSTALELPSVESSGGCARGGDTSRSASPLQLPLHSTTLRNVVGGVVCRLSGTDDSGNREEEVHEKHDGLRAQKRPLPEWLPGLLLSGGVRNCWPTRLPRPLRYLHKKNLAQKEEEEEEEEEERRRRTQQETSQLQQHGPLAGAASSSHSVRRKRKKRSKKKLPKAPLPRCGRPCALQRQVPAVESALRFRSSTTCGHSCCAAETGTHSVLHSPGAVLGQGRCARVVQRQVCVSMVQKTVESPQLHFIDGRRHSLSFRRSRSSWPSLFSGPLRFRSCRTFFGSRCPCCACRADSQVPPWRRPRFFFCRQAQMIGIMAGMASKDSYAATQLCLAGFAGDDTARAVFPYKGLDVSVVCNVRCWPCLCSTVEVRSCSSSASWSYVYGGFWKNLLYFST